MLLTLLNTARAAACLTITDVAVFEPDSAALLPLRQDVRVCGDRIDSVTPHDTTIGYGEMMDGAGMTLLPGLVDLHTHIAGTPAPPWDLARPDVAGSLSAWLQAGVTTILELGGTRSTPRWAKRTATDPHRGPTIRHAGIRLAPPSGHLAYTMRQMARDSFGFLGPLAGGLVSRPMTHVVRSVKDAHRAIDKNVEMGARFTKLDVEPAPGNARGMPPELMRAIAAHADAVGAPAVAHVGGPEDTAAALDAGIRIFAHSVNTASMPDALIDRMVAEDATVISTLILPVVMTEMADGEWQPSQLDVKLNDTHTLALVTGRAGEAWRDSHHSIVDWIGELAGGWAAQNLARMRERGVTVLPGTDAVIPASLPGAGLHRELALLVERAGYTPSEVLAAATGGAATLLGEADNIGRVAPGMQADLLLVEGDPTDSIEQLSNIVVTWRAGVAVSSGR